jgi:lipopolysaccharide export system protein LptA
VATFVSIFAVLIPLVSFGQEADSLSARGLAGAAEDSEAVRYEADRVTYDLSSGEMVLEGRVRLRYREVDLSAGRVVFHRERRVLEAEGAPDSTGRIVDLPVFRRAGEEVRGARMTYDLRTGQGQVTEGRTTFERKVLHGTTIRTGQDRTVRIRGGSLTTCDLDHPHTDFYCRDLKVIPDDKAIARSVLFRVGGVPVAWAPFYVFPIKQGRRSGILTPNFGGNARDGLFVTNLGYYFGSSDYWDATASLSLRERGGALVRTDARYALRDRFNGSLDVAFEARRSGGQTTGRGWRVEGEHYQRLGRLSTLRGSGSFLNDREFNRQNSSNLYDRLNRSLRSNLSYDRRWEGSGNSLQVIFLHEQDLETEETRFLSFPAVTFRGGHRPLWKAEDKSTHRRERGERREEQRGRRWYETIFYSFNGGVTNSFTRGEGPGEDTQRLDLAGGLSMSSQQQAFGWLNVTPGVTVNQRLSRNDQGAPTRQEGYAASASMGTTLYGLFRARVGRLRAVRHVVRPSLSFSFSQDATVQGGTFGFGGRRRAGDPRRTLAMGLGNTFQVKTEVDGKERRSDLATVDLFTNHDFEARGRGWSPLTLSAALKPDRRFDVRLNASADLYDGAGRFTPLRPHLNSLNVTSILRLEGRRKGEDRESQVSSLRSQVAGPGPGSGLYDPGFGFERDLYADVGDSRQPWQVSLTHYHTLTRFSGGSSKTSVLKLGAAFNLTGGWRVDYSINGNLAPDRRLRESHITAQTVSVYRSLHEWELRVSWSPTGFNKGAYFKLNLKDIPQFKIERRSGAMGGF